jgi:hypothetical protein
MPASEPRIHAFRHTHRERDADASNVRWSRDVPDAIRSLDTLADPDYADIVTATVSKTPQRTPEEWVRVALQGMPRGLLLVVPPLQRIVLGLRLERRRSPDHVLGWKITHRDEHQMRLEASSWLLTAHIVGHIDEGVMSFATFLRYERAPAALIWAPISLIHRQVALALVRSAARA